MKKAQKRKLKWTLAKIKSKENYVKEVIDQKFSHISGIRGSIEDVGKR